MDKLVKEAPQPLRGRMYQHDTFKPKVQRILVLKTGVAGLQFHIENEEEQAALDAITPGTELMLFREPENEYDEWAIAVHLTKEDKLGFISRFKNETIARLMDAGKKFIGVVDEVESFDEDTNTDSQRISHAPTENMSLPFSVYLIEEV